MNVNLTVELEELVHSKVQTGRYNSASEVVREALRLMQEQDQIKEIYKEEIRSKIAAGMQSAREGKVINGEVFMTELQNELGVEIRSLAGRRKQIKPTS